MNKVIVKCGLVLSALFAFGTSTNAFAQMPVPADIMLSQQQSGAVELGNASPVKPKEPEQLGAGNLQDLLSAVEEIDANEAKREAERAAAEAEAAENGLPGRAVVLNSVTAGELTKGYFFESILARGLGPGVIYLHGDAGLTPADHYRAQQLAEAGFNVVMPDLYGGAHPSSSFELVALRQYAIDKAADLGQWYNYVQARSMPADRIGAVGFEIGGQLALRLSTTGILNVTILFYPEIELEEVVPFFEGIRGPILAYFGRENIDFTPRHANAFRRALFDNRKPNEIKVLDALDAGFANPLAQTYDADWARRSWVRTQAYLKRYLKEK